MMVVPDALANEAHEIYHQLMETPQEEIGMCDAEAWAAVAAECTRTAKIDVVTIYWSQLAKKLYSLWGHKKIGGPSKKDLCVFNIIARHLVYLSTSSGSSDAFAQVEQYKKTKWPKIFKQLMERNDPC